MRPKHDDRLRAAAIAGLVVLGTVLAFWPVLGNGWIGDWDDGPWLVANTHYRGLGTSQLRWMFTTLLGKHYQPLTWITYACDYLLWGLNPAGYHATNLAVHAASAALYFLLARRLLAAATGQALSKVQVESAFAALLFSIHPLRVEPVAWAADRRDLLAGFFFLATVLAYLRAQAEPRHRQAWLGAACGAYALSLLSKGVGLSLPVVLLVLDWYPGRRLRTGASLRAALIEKIPFALMSAASFAGLAAAQSGALRTPGSVLRIERLDQAVYGMAFYLGKTIFPAGLAAFYEIPTHWAALAPIWLLCAALTGLITVLAVRLRREFPALLAAWVCYAATVFPMLGLATDSYQLAADRYTYLSCLAWPLLAAAGLRRARSINGPRASAFAAVLVAMLGALTWRQTLFWRDPQSLWAHTLELEPDSVIAHMNFGNLMVREGRLDEAAAHYQKALDLNQVCVSAQDRLAAVFDDPARAPEAAELRRVLMVNPACLAAYGNLISADAARGKDLPRAEAYYRQMLSLGLRRQDLDENLAKVLRAEGK